MLSGSRLRAVRSVIARRFPAPLAGVLAGALLLSGCGAPAPSDGDRPAGGPARVSLQPGAGKQDVNPGEPVVAKVGDGRFDEVALTNADGDQVEGGLSEDGTTWRSAEPLGYGKTYTWSGKASGDSGRPAQVSGEFSTLDPESTVRATVNPTDDAEVGVAMPVSVKFDEPVQDKAAVQRALHVDASQPVEGEWAWLSDQQVNWRPKEYWPAHTHVKVRADLYGVPYGNGAFGRADLTSEFDVGRSQVVKSDVRTHRMLVERDGQQVADYPASYGEEYDPGRNTPNGTYSVMEKKPVVIMDNPRYGYRDVRKTFAVRMSNHGEFIHENEENASALGQVNNSHGCINLSAADARAYFDSALVGDPIEVTGSASHMPPVHDVYDWMLSWPEWQEKSAL